MPSISNLHKKISAAPSSIFFKHTWENPSACRKIADRSFSMSLSLMSHLRMALATCGFFLALRAEPAFSADPLLGVYGGNSMNHVLDFEQWLGREVDGILCTVDYRTWENYRHADWLSHTVYGNRGQRRLIYDVPIIIEGANYKTAKTGAYDSHWKSLAESIIANNPGDYDIVIRPSHEMNGDWFVWGVGGSKKDQIPDFIASWRRFHGVFRSVVIKNKKTRIKRRDLFLC